MRDGDRASLLALWSADGDGRGAGSDDLEWTGRKGGRIHRQAVAPAPFGRSGVNPSDLRNVVRFADRTERADLLFIFKEVQVHVGDRLPDAQQQRGKQSPSLQYATRSGWHARHLAPDRGQLSSLRSALSYSHFRLFMGRVHGNLAQGAAAMIEHICYNISIMDGKRHMALESKPPVQSVVDGGERQWTRRGTLHGNRSALRNTRRLPGDCHDPA